MVHPSAKADKLQCLLGVHWFARDLRHQVDVFPRSERWNEFKLEDKANVIASVGGCKALIIQSAEIRIAKPHFTRRGMYRVHREC